MSQQARRKPLDRNAERTGKEKCRLLDENREALQGDGSYGGVNRIIYYRQKLVQANPQASERAEAILRRFAQSLPDAEPYKLVQLLYDMIAQNVTYDHAALEQDPPEETTFLWYKPLLIQTGVCEGIAQLFLRLCLAKRIPCQIIHGEGDGGGEKPGLHAWNIVFLQLPGCSSPQWYHLDVTWDLQTKPPDYEFFLKSDVYMESHRHQWLRQNFPSAPGNAPALAPLPRKAADAAGKLLQIIVKEG